MTTWKTVSISCALGLVAVAVASGGCGGSVISAVCAELCVCKPCTDADRTACEDKAAADQQKAETLRCSSQFDVYASCVKDNLSCENSAAAEAKCRAQLEALATCSLGVVPFKDTCEQASYRLVACKIPGATWDGSGAQPPCAGTILCNAACINNALCDQLVDAFSGMADPVKSKPFLDCTAKCSSAPP